MLFIFGFCAYFSGRREKKKIGGKVCFVFYYLNIITVISGVVKLWNINGGSVDFVNYRFISWCMLYYIEFLK